MQFRNIRLLALGLLLAGCEDEKEPVALVSVESVDFGHVPCGTTQVPRRFSLGNSGLLPFNFTTSFATGTHYMVQPASGFVLPGQQVELTVFSEAIPQHSAITENLYADTLTITTDIEGDPPRELPITQTASGAILELTGNVAIAAVEVASVGTGAVTLRNVGNAAATNIELAAPTPFTVAPAAIAELAPGAETSPAVTFKSLDQGPSVAPISIARASGLCAPLPASLAARGETTFTNPMPTAITFVSATGRSNDSTLLVRLSSGRVASLGDNVMGARGAGTSEVGRLRATLVRTDEATPLDGVTSVVGGRGAVCALRTDGSTWCWGNRAMGRARNAWEMGTFAERQSQGARAIAMSYGVRCTAASADDAVTCEASTARDFSQFSAPAGLTAPAAIALHPHGGYVVNSNGTVTSFGSNNSGERGNTDGSNSTPSLVTGLTDVAEVIGISGKPTNTSRRGACARKTDGTVWCWGEGRHGRLGNGNGADADSPTPVQVMIDAETPLTGVTAISGSHGHRCATTPTNVYCWGKGGGGRLGRANESDTNPWAQPTEPAIANGISIATTQRGACVLRASGQIVCFGQTSLSVGPHSSIDAFTEAL